MSIDQIPNQSNDTQANGATATSGEKGEDRAKLSEQRRRELADFLRTRREKLKPEQVGITQLSRRRTPGLRREEVAELAGVGTTWYTWLEQARDIQPSADVLRRLGQALHMNPAEIRHMYTLAGKAPPIDAEDFTESVPPSLSRILNRALHAPAIALGRRWDMLEVNSQWHAVFPWFADYVKQAEMANEKGNYVRMVFGQTPFRQRMRDWEMHSRRLLAEFRASLSDSLEDPWVLEITDKLKTESPEFAQWWAEHDVRDKSVAELEYDKGGGEILRFERSMLRTPENPRVRLLVYTPGGKQD